MATRASWQRTATTCGTPVANLTVTLIIWQGTVAFRHATGASLDTTGTSLDTTAASLDTTAASLDTIAASRDVATLSPRNHAN